MILFIFVFYLSFYMFYFFKYMYVIYLFLYLCCILHYYTCKLLYNMFTLKLLARNLNCANFERAEVERADKCTTRY